MTRKPLTLRSAVIVGTALVTGSAAGTLTDAVMTHLGYTQPGSGQVAAAMATLWILDKLNTLIDDTE